MVEKKKKPKKKKEKGAERRGEVKSGVRKRKQPTFVVGIGASAGGIKALETFFSNVTSDSGMAFVVVQHLDPHHESMMSSLLAKETSLKVHNAQDGMPVEPNQIYLRPPGKNLTIKNQILHLSKVGEKEGARLPIDSFFRSLSEDLKERAIGIVLSGASTDGTLGAKSIQKCYRSRSCRRYPAHKGHARGIASLCGSSSNGPGTADPAGGEIGANDPEDLNARPHPHRA
jgi:two-component system CheB/CheR fusion protein